MTDDRYILRFHGVELTKVRVVDGVPVFIRANDVDGTSWHGLREEQVAMFEQLFAQMMTKLTNEAEAKAKKSGKPTA